MLVDTMATREQAWECICKVFRTLNYPQLCEKTTLQWSNRMTSTAGTALFRQLSQRGIITISIPLWNLGTEKDRIQTLVHEACHIAQRYVAPSSASHGKEWQVFMRKCGHAPKRCHSIDNSSIRRKRKPKVKAWCPCGYVTDIGPGRARKIAKGISNYLCRKCRGYIQIETP